MQKIIDSLFRIYMGDAIHISFSTDYDKMRKALLKMYGLEHALSEYRKRLEIEHGRFSTQHIEFQKWRSEYTSKFYSPKDCVLYFFHMSRRAYAPLYGDPKQFKVMMQMYYDFDKQALLEAIRNISFDEKEDMDRFHLWLQNHEMFRIRFVDYMYQDDIVEFWKKMNRTYLYEKATAHKATSWSETMDVDKKVAKLLKEWTP